MSDHTRAAAGLRERLTSGTEDKLGKALADLFENPLVSGTIGRAFDARERAAQAQELAFSALNIPTAADIERLTRRLRSVSQRLEGIEDGVHRLNRALSDGGVERRLASMEEQLKTLSGKLSGGAAPKASAPKASAPKASAPKASAPKASAPKAAVERPASKRASPKRSTGASRAKKGS
jgi:TolA-binding protein